jgi:regulation of enolase protein 1 (concanavalin A-like superfamily)
MLVRFRVLVVGLAVCFIAAACSAEDKPTTFRGWGTLTDPDNDCTVKEEAGKLTMTVPGGTHDLNQALGGMKAPRILQPVEGDFRVQVKVSGEFAPGDKAADARAVPFNGAGLLIWQDEKNYLRLERNIWWVAQAEKTARYPPLIEYYKDGQYQETNPMGTFDEFFKGRSTWLKLDRRGDKVTASYSHDGKDWTAAKEITVELPKKIQLGVAAVNTSTKPFKVEFEEFKLTAR